MGQVNIFVEGAADQVFVKDVIVHHFKLRFERVGVGKGFNFISESILIASTGGWTRLAEQGNIDYFAENIEGKNLLIFDADDSSKTQGGYAERLAAIDKLLNDRGVTNFNTFLFPSGEASGDLETLLMGILNAEKKEAFFKCFDSLEECLKEIKDLGDLTTPNGKAKVFSFASTFLPDSKKQQNKAKEENRNYLDRSLWDLDHKALNPLVVFLEEHLAINP
jgi:hypothetical protein